jgi:DNA-binding LacI/PurR family transcriptional regulator
MRTDPVLQATEAVDMLMARIGGHPYKRPETCYETRLVIRKSCGQKLSEART